MGLGFPGRTDLLHGMQEVGGSIPPDSTNLFKDLAVCAEAEKVP